MRAVDRSLLALHVTLLWRVEHCVGSRALSLSYAAAFDPDQQGRASEQVAEKNESDTVYIYVYTHYIL